MGLSTAQTLSQMSYGANFMPFYVTHLHASAYYYLHSIGIAFGVCYLALFLISYLVINEAELLLFLLPTIYTVVCLKSLSVLTKTRHQIVLNKSKATIHLETIVFHSNFKYSVLTGIQTVTLI